MKNLLLCLVDLKLSQLSQLSQVSQVSLASLLNQNDFT